MRTALSQNVVGLAAKVLKECDNRPLELARRSGVALSTVQRVMSGATGASVDVIEQIATALEVSTYQLLIPNLDPENPQIVIGASSAEKRLYANMRKAARETPSSSR